MTSSSSTTTSTTYIPTAALPCKTFEREDVIQSYDHESITLSHEREALITTYLEECDDMLVPEFTKQPYESCFLAADFVNVMDTDVEDIDLVNSTITAIDVSGDTDNTVLNIGTKAVEDDTKLKVRILDGTEAKSPYKFTFRIITTQNNKWEKDVSMKIEDL